jgi:hypothetical protein
MELGLQSYGVMMPVENICIKLNAINLNRLQRCAITRNYKILHRVVQTLSQHNIKLKHHCHIQKLSQRK